MALPSITFTRGTSGLGRPLAGEDHFSGMVFYIANANLPSGFSTSVREKTFFSLQDAEDAGILDTHLNETKATGSIQITGVGSNGDTIEVKVLEYDELNLTQSVSLGTYTKTASETTAANVATALAAVINTGTATHGYTASPSTDTVTITAREGLGIFLNSGTPISTTIVGGITRSITQFASGVASDIDQLHYHISEFFRIQPKGVLYVGIYAPESGSYAFADVATLFTYSSGKIRQIGVYVTGDTLDAALVTALDAKIMTQAGLMRPASAVLTADFVGTALSALPTLANNSDYRVTVDIAQDMGGKGYELYKALNKTIGTMGALLGTISLAKVSESIAWVGKFDLSDGNELETIGFGNGALFSAQSTTLLDTLDGYKYVFLRKYENKSGSFWSDSETAIATTSDFSQIENVRTVDKAIRGIYANTLGLQNSPLQVKPDGTLYEDSIATFEEKTALQLDEMVRNTEISAYSINIDPSQDVLTTSTITISVSIVPIGVARQIQFNVNLATNV